jgi:hypothetical protein
MSGDTKLMAQLFGRLAANKFDHQIPSHLDIPIHVAIVFAPTVGHDVPKQNQQFRAPAFWCLSRNRPHLL